jgi:hypothetical protein
MAINGRREQKELSDMTGGSIPAGWRNFNLLYSVWSPASLVSGCYWRVFVSGVDRPGCEAECTLRSSIAAENKWSSTSTGKYLLGAWWCIKKTFTFTFSLHSEINSALYHSPVVVKAVKSRRLRVRWGEQCRTSNSSDILVRKQLGKW